LPLSVASVCLCLLHLSLALPVWCFFRADSAAFNAYTALLLAGPVSLDTLGRGLVVDGWLRMRGWARIGVLVGRLRSMLDDVLAAKLDDPEMELGGSEVVACVARLVELDGLDH
jgi:ATP-dependent RNA helicase DHX57